MRSSSVAVHQHVGVAEAHEAGAFGVFDHAAFEGDGAKLVGFAADGSHEQVLPAAVVGWRRPGTLLSSQAHLHKGRGPEGLELMAGMDKCHGPRH